MLAGQVRRGAVEGKELSMTRRSPRPYGTGPKVIELKRGLAIRWCETVIDGDGAEHREWRYENLGAISKKEAESRLAEKLHEIRQTGPRLELVIPTFSEHVARYKRDILSMKRLSTRSVRTTHLDHHWVPRFGSKSISDIGNAQIQTFMTELCRKGYQDQAGAQQAYSAHTLHDIAKAMKTVMDYAVKWYRQPVDRATRLPFNPASDIDLPVLEPKNQKWALTEEQSGKLIGRLQGKAKAMVALALVAGMRRGELLALRVCDIFVERRTDGDRWGVIQIRAASYRGEIGPPKTKKGYREIPVHPWVLAVLEDWIRLSSKRAEDLLFGTRKNRPENPDNILRRHVYPACRALGVPNANWLTLRGTYSTWAHEQGVSARTIADILGHAKVNTQFIYIRSMDEKKWDAAGKRGTELCKIVQEVEQEAALVH